MQFIDEFNVPRGGQSSAEDDKSSEPTASNWIWAGLYVGWWILIILIGIAVLWWSGHFDEKYMGCNASHGASRNTSYMACGNACGAYDMLNMDEYSVMGPHSAAMVPPPCSVIDHIHESLAYDCYSKPDAFLKKLDRQYQPHGIDGIGVLSNSVA